MAGLIFLIFAAFLFAVFGVIGLLIKTKSLSKEIRELSLRLDRLADHVSRPVQQEQAQTPQSINAPLPEEPAPVVQEQEPEDTETEDTIDDTIENIIEEPAVETAYEEPEPEKPPVLFTSIRNFIKTGNFWAAGGIVLLITGFATLIAYLAGRGFFTLEMGIIAAAITGLALLVSGWLLRKKKPVYCLFLQGGGIGILYLSVFAAHKLTAWFAPVTALVLLAALVLPAVILALVQKSQALAILGFLGGFAAPLLIASNEGNHVFLFSFYAVLCLGIFAIGLFRFWRQLNLLAFVSVFGSALYWAAVSYKPELFWTVEPFFLLFTLIFTALGIHGFGKRILRQDAYFDSLLLLGTPALAAVLQWRIFRFVPHGLALVSLFFSAFYLCLAVFIWKRKGKSMRLFSESYLGLAVMLANLAAPLELAPGITSAVWSAEGALFFFLGFRLKKIKIVIPALLLHVAAAIAFAVGQSQRPDEGSAFPGIFRSPAFTGAMVIALAGMALIVIAHKFRERSPQTASGFFSRRGVYHHAVFIILALWMYGWWYGGWLGEFIRVFPKNYAEYFFLFCTLTALAGFLSSKLLRCKVLFLALVPAPAFAFCLVVSAIIVSFGYSGLPPFTHNFFYGLYLYGWIAFFAVYAAIAVFLKNDLREAARGTLLFILVLIAAAVLSFSGRALTVHFALAPSWRSFLGTAPVFAAMFILVSGRMKVKANIFGASSCKLVFFVLPAIFSCILWLWFLVTLFLPGDPAPLPVYIPVVNPLDLLEAFSILIFIFWQASLMKTGPDECPDFHGLGKTALFVIADTALFLFASALAARALHFYGGLPYSGLFDSDAFQLVLFVLWALYGIAHIAAGTRFARRKIWIAGAVLIICDVAKLLVLDLAAASTVIRIISFFAAGAALLFIGWISPLPPSLKEKHE